MKTTIIENNVKETHRLSSFSTDGGAEFFVTLEAPRGLNSTDSVNALCESYEGLLKRNSLNINTEIFIQFYLSDIASQAKMVRQILKIRREVPFYFMIGQPPASGSKIALEAYHIKSTHLLQKERISENILCMHHNQYKSIWIKNRPEITTSTYEETRQLFNNLSMDLNRCNTTIKDALMRTWIYVRNIDDNYQGMVNARRDFFSWIGLNHQTHYAASTGIGGDSEDIKHHVSMDSLSISGLDPKQVRYLNAPEHMNEPHEYGVTFERGLRVTYGDRSHYYISGTASIDKDGQTIHVDDIKKQTRRTIMNMKALLQGYGADLNDMKVLTVYLRNVSDAPYVTEIIKETFPNELPYSIVCGAVCRPLWLVEIDGFAVSGLKNERFAPFC